MALLGMALCCVQAARAGQPATGSAVDTSTSAGELPMADKVVVQKSLRTLTLYHRGVALREYPVQLGLRPEGAKQSEGDFRTPEGHYELGRRNAQSSYFLSVHIDYPNAQDIARAKRQRTKPGGAIMVHGLPNTPTRPAEYYQRFDWTDGCIALSNTDMVEFWLMTRSGTPIHILP